VPAERPTTAADPTDERLFPLLDERHLALIDQVAQRRSLAAGEVVFEHGVRDAPFVVLVEGRLEFHDRGPDGDRFITDLLPGTFVGDLSIFTGEPTIAECRAGVPSVVLVLDRPGLQALTAQHPDLGDLLLGTMALRREWLEGRGFGQVRVLGTRSSAEAFTIRDLLARNLIPHRWVDVETAGEDAAALAGLA
jgi:thioredoxin reductase (NADPH)